MDKEKVKVDEELEQIPKEFAEMIEKADSKGKLTKDEYDKLYAIAKESTEFMKLLDDIKIPEDRYVVFTDGDVQLFYEEGEFFLTSAVDSNAQKKKIKRKEAMDLNLEFFIKYQINPILEIKKNVELQNRKKVRAKSKSQLSKNSKSKKVDEVSLDTKKEIEEKENEIKKLKEENERKEKELKEKMMALEKDLKKNEEKDTSELAR